MGFGGGGVEGVVAVGRVVGGGDFWGRGKGDLPAWDAFGDVGVGCSAFGALGVGCSAFGALGVSCSAFGALGVGLQGEGEEGDGEVEVHFGLGR